MHRKEKQESGSGSGSGVKLKYTTEQLNLVRKIQRTKNFYEVLGVRTDSTNAIIRKAYKNLALQVHPDKNHAPGATEAFKVVGNAAETLSDPKKREIYDLKGGTKNVNNNNYSNHNHYHERKTTTLYEFDDPW